MKHRWYPSKWMQGVYCSTCQISSYERNDSECLVARHADPAIDKLYRARRKAAMASDESGWKGIEGWESLEQIEAELRKIDPDGDWRYEGNRYDGQGWTVRRPEVTA